jgi:hypothetical protein
MAEGDTLVNAVIGGIVSIVLSFTALSPALGGAVAGYLQGGDRSTGIRVGAYAGLVAAVPLVLFGLFVSVVLAGFALDLGSGGTAGFGLVVLFFVVAIAAFTVGLSALGGWVGNYVRYDTDFAE